jgi:hypothetical protein
MTVLLYGRLAFRWFGEPLRIRYNTLGRIALEPALLELRKRPAGPREPVPREEGEPQELPFKWRHLLSSSRARLHRGAPAAFRFAEARGTPGNEIGRGQLLVLSPHELVYLRDPPEASHCYGEDSLIVPRSRINGARVERGTLRVCSNGLQLSLSMKPELCEAAARCLA